MFSVKVSLLVVTFASHISWVLTLKKTTKEFKAHTHMHHVVIIITIIIFIIVMLTLCYSIMSHAILILFFDRTSMLTLDISLMSHALWVPTSIILRNLERSYIYFHNSWMLLD